MKVAISGTCLLSAFLLTGLLSGCSRSNAGASHTWNPKAAAHYLDQRAQWWMGWQGAARGNGSFCISCHTTLPYALSRVALHTELAENAPTPEERKLLENVRTRVRLSQEAQTYYNDTKNGAYKSVEARGTEAVLNALVLASYDSTQGRITGDTRHAFENMWALQEKTGGKQGAWWWLQFGLRPWEASDSEYYGAALAALAVGVAPENYRLSPEIQDNLRLLRDYLHRNYQQQTLSNRVVLLWAATKWPGLIDAPRQASLTDELLSQQRGDGGWSLSALNRTWKGSTLRTYLRSWIRSDHTLVETGSDGYATGVVVFVLQQAGTPVANPQLQRGLAWLRQNQDPAEGRWVTSSLNLKRQPASNIAHFMSDAATAYAVLALTESDRRQQLQSAAQPEAPAIAPTGVVRPLWWAGSPRRVVAR